jgi:dipeptidyl aminopeptidase/acylaminoacyl peptidase
MKPLVLLAVWLGLASLALCAEASPPELPVADFFGLPTVSHLRFSPNGRYLAALQPWKRRMNLMVVDTQKLEKTQITAMTSNDVADFFWANDERLFFLMDDDGKERFNLFAINRDGSKVEPISHYNRFAVLGKIHGDPDHLVVTTNDEKPTLSDVYHFDLRTGKARLHVRNPGHFAWWVADHAGVARLGIEEEQGVTTVYYRDRADTDDWQKLARFADGAPRWTPLEFDGDNRTLFVASDIGRKTLAVFRYDTATRQLGDLVCGDDTYNVASTIYNDALNRVIGVGYEAEKPRTVWLDGVGSAFARFQRGVDAALPATVNQLREASDDNSKLLVWAASDRDPGTYYHFDTRKGTLEVLATARPAVKPELMAPMQPVTFFARDGLVLHGYLTLPVGRPARKLPLILNPHGGPFGPRDNWGYNPEVQLLANRGYAVLQVNYRGSGGYGDWFERAGYKRWGLEMQNDLTDAVQWAIAEGIADPARVVICGASYGGYATMAGLVFTPELYCAGINYVGVTDIMALVSNPYLGTNDARNSAWWLQSRIGDYSRESAQIKATSPVNFADRIRAPLLMGYGKNDPRVDYDHHAAPLLHGLKKAGRIKGRDYWMIIEEHEGHGFGKEENRIAFYTKVDEFLKKFVPPADTNVKLGPTKFIELPAKP